MTYEEKQLLLADLSARLPYGVICYGVTKDTDEDGNYIDEEVTDTLCELHIYKCCYGLVGLMNKCNIESIKPYLRPRSSMTEEEIKEYHSLIEEQRNISYFTFCSCVTRYLDSIHVDHRAMKDKDGKWKTMIELGLAFEAPDGMYK